MKSTVSCPVRAAKPYCWVRCPVNPSCSQQCRRPASVYPGHSYKAIVRFRRLVTAGWRQLVVVAVAHGRSCGPFSPLTCSCHLARRAAAWSDRPLTEAINLLRRVSLLDVIILITLAAWVSFQVSQRYTYWDNRLFINLHITLAAAMICARFIQEKRGLPRWVVGVPALVVVLYSAIYFSPYGDIFGADLFSNNYLDRVIGGLVLVVASIMVWYAFGITFALLGPIFVAYMFFGPYTPRPFTVPDYGVDRITQRLTLGSAYGDLTYDVANYLWLLIFWGMLIEVSGAGRSIRLVAHLLSRRFASGPGLAAVISSALVGSFTGTGSANVMVTGPITIPLMRRAGYKAHQAGAIESAASTAAGLTPPVMGIVPFIMADRLGVPYTTILTMVLLIAVIWYASVIAYVIAMSARLDLKPTTDDQTPNISLSEAVRSGLLMVVPVTSLIFFILRNYALMDAVLYALIVLLVMAVGLRVERRPKVWWEGVRRAAVMASAFTMAIVIVQLITDVMFFSTLILRIGLIVDIFSQGNLIMVGLVIMVFGVIISGPLPPLAVYFIMVLTFNPVFFDLGIPASVSVFTAFYMGVLGAITPPMAPSPMVAAGIAQARFWDTTIETMKVASGAFFIPFLILLAPELLLSAPGVEPSSTGHVALVFSTVIVTLGALAFALAGWFIYPLRMPARVPLGGMAILMVAGLHEDSDALLWVSLLATIGIGLALSGLPFRLGRSAGSQPAIESTVDGG